MKIIDAFIPIFEYMVKLSPELVEESTKTVEVVREELKPLFKEVSALPQDNDNVNTALFAACAFIDEKILESEWSARDEWSKMPLQKEHFDTNVAGELFFSKIDDLNENVDIDQQVREVYLYCLVQGFSGCYFEIGQQSFLQDLVQSNYALLSIDASIPLFAATENIPEIPPSNEQFSPQIKEQLSIWGPILFVILTYVFLRNDLLDTITRALVQI